jgi:hypothetical protein
MQFAMLDLDSRLPQADRRSSRAFRYGFGVHLAAARAEAAGTRAPTTAAPPACPRTEYLLGFAVRAELRRAGLLLQPDHLRPRRRPAARAR